jgi:UDP-2-acetamido-3-amino-2,3-dideoxy-glucuronate N-acetyltransferase
MKNIAVIGCGYWGKNLIRNFHEIGSLYALCDASQKSLDAFKEKYPDVKSFLSYEELLNDKNIKGVVIAAPAVYHYQLAKDALLKEKDVFVEKPLSLKVSDAEELVDIAKKKNLILMVGHLLQYHQAVIKLKSLIERGDLGKIQYIYSNRLNMGKIRTEENILWSFAPHDISVILKLLNEFPESVAAKGGNYLQSDVSDVTLTTMDFPSGVKAHIFVSWLHPFKEQKLVVVGSKKMALFDDMTKEKLFLYPHRVDWVDRAPVAFKGEPEVVELKLDEPLRFECQTFIDSIETRKSPVTDGDEGVRVLKILDSFQKSLDSSGKTIEFKKGKANYFVHSTACIDNGVEIGKGTSIWHFSHLLKGSTVGENCKIGQNVVIGPNAVIGNGCKIQNNVSVYDGVVLEDGVFCGPSMVFTNVINPRSEIVRMHELKKTLVKKGTSIGANATVICGHTLGKYSFIGAAAVVTKDVPDYALIVGNPGRIAGWMCECGTKLTFSKSKDTVKEAAICAVCKRGYSKSETIVEKISEKETSYADSIS